MTQDAIRNLLSTAQEKADSLNSKLDPQLTQNYRELMIENWGLSIGYWEPLGTFCGSWLHFCEKWFLWFVFPQMIVEMIYFKQAKQ